MTGFSALPTTAAGVVDTIKQVWYLVVVAVAVHSAEIFFSKKAKGPPVARLTRVLPVALLSTPIIVLVIT